MALNSTALNASRAFTTIIDKGRTLKSGLQAQRAIFAANGASGDVIINAMRGVKATRDIFTAEKTTAGLNAYAKLMYDDQALDFVAQVDAVITACNGLLTWVATNFPKDANGYLLKDKIVNGEIEARTFTAAALTTLVVEVDALIAAL